MILTQYSYDNQNRLTGIEHRDGMTLKQGFDYTFDANSNVATVTHEDGSRWEYGYDGRDRLVLAVRYDDQGVEEYREAYAYDAGDNLVTKTVTEAGQSPVTTTFTVNAANELVTQSDGVTNVTYTYDAAGRQASKYDGTYTTINSWRYADMLYKVETDEPGVPDVEYLYGGDGMRRERTTTDGAYAWYNEDGSEESATGALERTFVGGLAEVIGSDPATGSATYFTQDRLGSTRGLYDGAKSLIGSMEFTPYGQLYSAGTPATDSLYTGHTLDPVTEVYYTQFRYYDPATARWLSREPLGLDGPNLYHYALGNPVNFTDPDGLAARGEGIVGDFLGERIPSSWGESWMDNAAKSPGGACAAGAAGSFFDGLSGAFGGPQFGSFNPAPDATAGRIGEGLGVTVNPVAAVLGPFGKFGRVFSVLNRNKFLRLGKGYLHKGATRKHYRIAIGGKKQLVHGHIHRGNWWKPWRWLQKLGNWRRYD